jgi:type II secretory pathway pseudopilin PulG
MSTDRTCAARRASLRARRRARVRARLRAQRGDTLIEVLIAALMVALIATASLGGFSDIGHLSEDQRNEEQASALAQQDQARLRGLPITELSGNNTSTSFATATTGNTSYPVTVDGTIYTVTSASQFISGSGGTAACTSTGATGTADEVQTSSTVTWGTNNGGRAPVIIHGLVTPSEGGSLVVTVDNPNGLIVPAPAGSGIAGVTISLSGPSSVSPLVTDSNGCAVFAGLSSGTYTITYTPPAGTWLTSSGATTIPTQTATVTTTQTATASLVIGNADSLTATFQTTLPGSSTAITNESDTFVLANNATTPTDQVYGTDSTKTNNSFAPSVATGSTLFPYPASLTNDEYSAWAGGCAGDEPQSPNTPVGFTLAGGVSGGTSSSVVINEPAMVLLPYSGSSSSNPGSLLTPSLITVTDSNSGCGSNEDYPPIASAVSATAGALAYPGEPYGTFSVCISTAGTHGTVHNTQTVTNTSYTGTTTKFYLNTSTNTNGACT